MVLKDDLEEGNENNFAITTMLDTKYDEDNEEEDSSKHSGSDTRPSEDDKRTTKSTCFSSSTPPFISYEQFMWTVFIILSALAIIDRFVWNVWPRQTYKIGSGNAGGDRMEGYKPGPWSVVLYDGIARISGRYSIICYNFLLLTRMESWEDFVSKSFIAKYCLDCRNIVNANIRLHTYTGILLCILTLLHVWSILFPCVFHGYSATVVVGNFEWPISERTPTKCSVEDVEGCWPGDANPDLKQMGLQADDVFRMVEMTIFLLILMPLSIKWLTSQWHAGIQLHRLINIVYFVDIVRRHSHPHSWILNGPMFILYCIDKILYSNYWHRNKSPEVKKVKIGKDFMVLYFKSKFGLTDTVGPDYALRLNASPVFESKHVFTSFENRSESYLDDEADGFDWSVGIVIRVFRRKRIPAVCTDKRSHTERMFDNDKCDMLVTGPRQGEMSEVLRYALYADDAYPLVLVGAGSAINFIIDTLQYCSVNKVNRSNASILYSTRDLHLFKWVCNTVSQLASLCEKNGFKIKQLKIAYTTELVDVKDITNTRTGTMTEFKCDDLRRASSVRFQQLVNGATMSKAELEDTDGPPPSRGSRLRRTSSVHFRQIVEGDTMSAAELKDLENVGAATTTDGPPRRGSTHRRSSSILYQRLVGGSTTTSVRVLETEEEITKTIDLKSDGPPAPPGRQLRRKSSVLFRKLTDGITMNDDANVDLVRNRIDFDESIAKKSTVLVQGSAGLKNAVKTMCIKKDAICYLGRGGWD